jgi:hypothetical protein
VLIGCALLCAPWLDSFATTDEDGTVTARWRPAGRPMGSWRGSSAYYVLYPLTVIYVVANLFVFVVAWFPPKLQDSLHTNSRIVTSYAGPTTGVLIYVAGALYWAWDTYVLPALGYKFEPLPEEQKADGTIEIRFKVSRVLQRQFSGVILLIRTIESL